MACSLTIFNSIFDNKTDKRLEFDSFEKFEEALYKLSEKPLKEKKDAVLISPSTYIKGTTRANKNVMYWDGWCCVDVDDHKFEGDLKNELTNLYGDFHFVCYSTASSKHGLPKFRLVFPTTERIGGDDIRAFWFALNTQLNSLADKQTKDLSRMYYIPGSYAGAFNFIFTNTGNYIDPKELMRKYPMPEKTNLNSFMDRLPEEMQKQIIEYRKGKLDQDFSWNNYRDCPFWPKNLANEYNAISNTGWYHKMYQIMVAIAGNAVGRKYPITAEEITKLCREFDTETGNWYKNRPLDKEADRAIEYVYRNI